MKLRDANDTIDALASHVTGALENPRVDKERLISAAAAVVFCVASGTAAAHTGTGMTGGFAAGFMHPLSGVDHMLAMLAVGMWGAQLGRPAIWVLPVAFPMIMAMGGVLGIIGISAPFSVEIGIVMSVIVLGAVIAFYLRPPLWAAILLVSFFALFHGYAHGVELADKSSALAYSLGFVIATGMIHVAGILIGMVTHLPRGMSLLRLGGGLVMLSGVYLAGGLSVL